MAQMTIDAPTRWQNWVHGWYSRQVVGIRRKQVELAVKTITKALETAEYALLRLGFINHPSDKSQVALRQSLRATKRALLNYSRDVSLIDKNEYERIVFGGREDAA